MAWVKTRTTDDGSKRFVACYRDPEGRQRSAGTYPSHRAALRAANREEAKVREATWHDHSRGHVTFSDYVQSVWLPSKHVETSTLAAYRSYLDKHFLPTLGKLQMGKILPPHVQHWVTDATAAGLSAASVRKYHTMLSSIFERALRDRVVTYNPCEHIELPKIIKKTSRTLTPAEYDAILAPGPRSRLPSPELDHRYGRHVEAWNHHLVAQIRRCGPATARRLGYKTRTFASDPHDRNVRRAVIWVVVTS